MHKKTPQFPYGAVYFRKSNPPKEDWERDYQVAKEDGNNLFRHWFMWGAIETAPGHYDWEDYDRQMDLAAQNGIKTIIAEYTMSVPEWAVSKYEHGLMVKADGTKAKSQMGVSTATGGFDSGGVLCLDCEEVREVVGVFLQSLAKRYKDHPAMLGYDIWNECNYAPNVCYCEHTKAKFRRWLERKYGTLEQLGQAWYRYSYTEWDQVQPPTQIAPYPECIDWLQFKKENFYEQMQWRIDMIRSVDPDNLMTAHGIAASLSHMASMGADDWLAASKVEVYGFTWNQGRKGNEPWKQWHAVDLVRSASRGKPFWHAEIHGGPLWMQPQVIGRDKEDGRVTDAEDYRVWNMISLAGGARGVMLPRWRPLLDGPLFGAFGTYGMDGSRTPHSEMGSKIAKWANAAEQKPLLEASPVQGEIGLLVVPEAQEFDYLLRQQGTGIPFYGSGLLYSDAMWGAYRGFFDNHIQADWVHIDDIDQYDTLYFPYPIMLTSEQAARLIQWVDNGGTLISEGCPAYFGDRGRVGTTQPNYGLHELFGAIEEEVEFMPDIGDRIRFELDGMPVQGGGFRQSYRLSGGTARGAYDDGSLAVIEHRYGKGRTLLVGTHPSIGYYRNDSEANRQYFSALFAWTGKSRNVHATNRFVQARIHEGNGRHFLWVVNPERTEQRVILTLGSKFGTLKPGQQYWGDSEVHIEDNTFSIVVPPRDAVIYELV